MPKKKKLKKEVGTQNVRIYESTLEIIRPLTVSEGKTIPRIIDEKFNPKKYRKSISK